MSTARPRPDYRLYLVTDPVMTASYGLVRTVREAVDGGVTLVQLRDTDADDDEFVRIGRTLHEALAGRVPLIVNDRVHLVEAIGAEGAHVGQGDLPIDQARAVLGPHRLLGLSVQSVGHLEVARALGEDLLDYVGIGPVWDTATKPDAAEAGGTDRTATIAATSPWPSVAIGGISLERVPRVRATGVDGISVVSAICGRPSPGRRPRPCGRPGVLWADRSLRGTVSDSWQDRRRQRRPFVNRPTNQIGALPVTWPVSQQVTEAWINNSIVILVTLLVALVVRGLLARTIRRITRMMIKDASGKRLRATEILRRAADMSDERYAARANTTASLLRNVLDIVLVIVVVMTIMNVLGVPMAPLLASASIGGVAIGFGAQSLVKDYLSGIFMVSEDQFGVGDWVLINDKISGRVEEVGLRVTRLRAFSGVVWYVRNGDINQLGNSSQGTSTAIIDVPIAPGADPSAAIDIMKQVLEDMAAEEEWQLVLIADPVVLGVDSMDAVQTKLRATADTLANQQWGFQREALSRIRTALHVAGIEEPASPPATNATS
ncbi:thiamine phosphate synthase [Raineyella fluvialis]|uniref:thiamine phosphate synthase n=1 Tax=Raineyella fluvialis TaxID=2662261 RepID=UPI001E561782|nr:thiamine phosphate synthase [Raineyella fluvialis]